MTGTPREIDEALAAKWGELAKAEQRIEWARKSIFREGAGHGQALYSRQKAQYASDPRYCGGYLFKLPFDEALAKVQETAAADETWKGREAGETLARYETATSDAERINGEIKTLNESYTGWSRFFLVTSSPGHIHSSMSCSTCRWTTTYGWLPSLSGKTETDAVAEHGPALCSVCFPSAPLDWTGTKLTKAQAAKKAAAEAAS